MIQSKPHLFDNDIERRKDEAENGESLKLVKDKQRLGAVDGRRIESRTSSRKVNGWSSV